LYNVASCWLYLLTMHGRMNVKSIRVTDTSAEIRTNHKRHAEIQGIVWSIRSIKLLLCAVLAHVQGY